MPAVNNVALHAITQPIGLIEERWSHWRHQVSRPAGKSRTFQLPNVDLIPIAAP